MLKLLAGALELFESKHLVYGYSNARVKARKAKILHWEAFEDFANQNTVNGVTVSDVSSRTTGTTACLAANRSKVCRSGRSP